MQVLTSFVTFLLIDTMCYVSDYITACIFISAEEGGYVFGSVCLSVCLSVCPSDYTQTCERILTKFFGGVGHGSRTK